MKGSPPTVSHQVIAVHFIMTMAVLTLTLVSAEKMGTFNKELTENRPFMRPFTIAMPFISDLSGSERIKSWSYGYADSHAPSKGDCPFAAVTNPSHVVLSFFSPADHAADGAHQVHRLLLQQDDRKTTEIKNTTKKKASSAIATTAPINSTMSLASFTGKGRQREEEKDAKTDTSFPLHPPTSTVAAADETTGKTSTGIKEGAPAQHIGPCTVMFIDLGACQMTASVIKFSQDKMQTLTTTHGNDKMLGSRLVRKYFLAYFV